MQATLESLPDREGRSLSLRERLSLIALIDEGMRSGASNSPIVAELFENLWELVDATIAGSKVSHLSPEGSANGFRVFEINADSGKNLGRLNMIYLKKPLPCYYLAYVEVAPLFRKQGLGHRILDHFRQFLIEKSALGILDNIIPEEDPTYNVYFKHCWEPVESVLGETSSVFVDNYMVFIPPNFQNRNLREPVFKLLHHLRRKRAVMDMKDNEVMVTRTIAEFRELCSALTHYFAPEIEKGEAGLLMRFLFTRFVTKFIAFRRRIGELLGYTGGESMEQIVLPPGISALPVQTYAPRELAGGGVLSIQGDEGSGIDLPTPLKEHPAPFVEDLTNYQRPSLRSWLEGRGLGRSHVLTLGDLMELGFDPTRLKECTIEGRNFIIERMQARQLPEIERKKRLLGRLAPLSSGIKCRGASLKVNPPLIVLQDRGNAYVLRYKIPGVHWEEAVEQLNDSPSLRALNEALNLDRLITRTVREAQNQASRYLEETTGESGFDTFAWFVSWDIKNNRPGLQVDFSGTFLEAVWVA
ncbi:MAG: hypothetical protein ACOWYE_12020 [Desulfatiglandales bacterium]